VIIWAEIEVQLAIILSCTAAFKTLAQHLFPSFMDGLASGSSRHRKTTGTPGTGAGAGTYVLQSYDRNTGFRTITRVEAAGGAGGSVTTAAAANNKQLQQQQQQQHQGDSDSLDSREHIVTAAGWPPRMETTISVHSSKRNSADEGGPVKIMD